MQAAAAEPHKAAAGGELLDDAAWSFPTSDLGDLNGFLSRQMVPRVIQASHTRQSPAAVKQFNNLYTHYVPPSPRPLVMLHWVENISLATYFKHNYLS